ncbi:MAG TPA: AMP-binding protein, partial [Micromonospora sp.]
MTDILPRAAAHGAALPYPQTTLPELVLARAVGTPDAVAVRQWDDRLTYRELVDRATALATVLRGLGVGPETRVGVCGSRRPDLVATVLGVLLSGGCYVPLDPGGPRQRLLEIVADAGIGIVVGDRATDEFGDVPGLRLVGLPEAAPAEPAAPARCPATLDDTAYVLFTSGSTGRPKGVLVTHRNLTAFVTGAAAATGVDASTRSVASVALAFDASVLDILVPLSAGGAVQLLGDADRADPDRVQRFLAAHEVNWGFLPPILLSLLDPARLP